jgi:hypothetical protein
MAIRRPIQNYVFTQQVGTTAVTGSSGAQVLRFTDFDQMTFMLTCSGITAASTLDVWVQTSPDGGTTFYDTGRFQRLSATGTNPTFLAASLGANAAFGTMNINTTTVTATAGATGLPLLSNVVQILWGLGGTSPSASFGVTGFTSNFNRGGQ